MIKFNIRQAVEDILNLQRDLASRKGVILHAIFNGFDDEDSYQVYSDQQRFMQVILNLQSNAIKFTMRGSVTIKVTLLEGLNTISSNDEEKDAAVGFFNVNKKSESKYLRVQVIDTGIGIKKEDQMKLFKLFGFVEAHSSSVNSNGIGLGLVISK